MSLTALSYLPLFRHDPTFLHQKLIQLLVVTLSVILIVSSHWHVYSISLWLKEVEEYDQTPRC
jgi:hypothetical protein